MSNTDGKRTQGARDYQEDFFSIVRQNEEDGTSDVLIVLADGMGGHSGGDVASKTAVRAFEGSFLASTSNNPKNRLHNALKVADQAIADRIAEDSRLEGMGCTLIGALRLNDTLFWTSVGDSHIFVLRKNELRKINADHSVKGELVKLVEQGKLTMEEVNANPKRNALRSALVGKTPTLIDERSLALEQGDIVILATDGVDTISQDELQDVVSQNKALSPEAISATVLKRVKDAAKPNQDNTTVVIYKHAKATSVISSENSRWTIGDTTQGADYKRKFIWILCGGLVVLAILAAVMMIGNGADVDPKTPEPTEPATVQSNEIIDNRNVAPQDPASGTDIELDAPDTPKETDAVETDQADDPTLTDPNETDSTVTDQSPQTDE